MKPNCLVCSKPLSKYGARHCKSHRPTSSKTRRLLSKARSLEWKSGLRVMRVAGWNKGIPAPWVRGENNPNWGKIGSAHPRWTGRTALIKYIRSCPPYKAWRLAIFQRDNWTCRICGVRSGKGRQVYLEADHYPVQFATILKQYHIKTAEQAINCEPLWGAEGRTLCRECHPRSGRFSKKDC